MEPLQAPGVAVDTEKLLWLRHLVRARREQPRTLTAMPGGFTVKRRGRGLEVDDIRVFSDGDDMRHLDRNTTARTGIPHVRTFRDERERTVILIADFRPSMLWGTRRVFRSVAAAEAAALAGWRAIDAGGRVGLVAFGAAEPAVVAPRGRERGMLAVVGALAAAHATALARGVGGTEPPLDAALTVTERIAPKGSAVVLISGFDMPGAEFDSAVGALQRRAQVSALVITDAFETRAPAGTYPFIDSAGRMRIGHVAPVPAPKSSPDARMERLARLGVDANCIDAEGGPDAMIAALEAFDASFR